MSNIFDIKSTVFTEIEKYFLYKKNIENEQKLYTDLGIYGDDLEEIIHSLANILKFNELDFWEEFTQNGYFSPGEINISFLPKFFF